MESPQPQLIIPPPQQLTPQPQQPQQQQVQTTSLVTVAVPPLDGTYCYIAIKGSLHSIDSSVFGLNKEEILALSKRYTNTLTNIVNGVNIKGTPIDVINSLSQLGYKVVCSTGETEVVWTMAREV